jgi:hypothetical protein
VLAVAGPNAISLLLTDALYADGPLLAWLKYRKGIDALEELLSVLGTPLEKGFFLRCSSLIPLSKCLACGRRRFLSMRERRGLRAAEGRMSE